MGIRIHRALAGIALAATAVSAQAQGTIKVGLVNEATGPNAEAGSYTVNGARPAREEAEAAGGILGSDMTNAPDVGIFAERLLQVGLKAESVGASSRITETAVELAVPALHGAYCIAHFTPDANEESLASTAKYGARYELGPNGSCTDAYDAMKVLAHAVTT